MSQPMMPSSAGAAASGQAASSEPTNQYQSSRHNIAQHIHVGLWRSIRSEYVKLVSLSSTWIILAINLLMLPAGAGLAAWTVKTVASIDPETGKISNYIAPTQASTFWMLITAFVTTATVVVGILGVICVTSEFSTTSIESSLTTNPHRNMMLAAKTIMVSVMVWFSTQLGILLSWAIVWYFFKDIPLTPLRAGEESLPWVSILGAPLVAVAYTVLSVGLGAICRSTAGGIFALVGLNFFLPALVNILSNALHYVQWLRSLTYVTPTELMNAFINVSPSKLGITSTSFEPNWWQAGLLFLVWVVIIYLIGAMLMKRRDIK